MPIQQLKEVVKRFFDGPCLPQDMTTIYSSAYSIGLADSQKRQHIIRREEGTENLWCYTTTTNEKEDEDTKISSLSLQDALERLATAELRFLGDTQKIDLRDQGSVRETRLARLSAYMPKTMQQGNPSVHVHNAVRYYTGYEDSSKVPSILEMKRLLDIIGAKPKWPEQTKARRSAIDPLQEPAVAA